jgi:alpha-amylase
MQNGTLIQYFHWYLPDDGQLWNQLSAQSKWLSSIGITAVWIPPVHKATMGGLSVGYDVYDIFDLGEFDQKGSVRTKYGTKAELVKTSKAVHKAGMKLYVDVVLNHKGGGDETEKFMAIEVDEQDRTNVIGEPVEIEAFTKFTFPARKGKYSNYIWDFTSFSGVDYAKNLERSGIFCILKDQENMWDNVIDDEKGNYDYLMYCDIDYRNHAVRDEVKWWGKWLHETIHFDGVRLDAVKHITHDFYNDWLDFMRHETGQEIFAVGEYWAPGRIDLLVKYLEVTEGRMSLFDAPLHHKMHLASQAGNAYDLTKIFDDTLVQLHPDKAVTVVDNHDTQPLQALEAVIEPWFKPHAYALILLREAGYPVVFYPDLFSATYTDTGNDGNKYEIYLPKIDVLETLIKVRATLAYGQQRDYFDHPNTIGWTREGIDEKKDSGCAVLVCNGDSGLKRMEVGMAHAGKRFVDITGGVKKSVLIGKDGRADFAVNAGSIAVWIRKTAATKIFK